MKKLSIISSIFVLIFFVQTTPVSAHFLATDGNIGAILHVDPDDDPIAGSPSTIFFEFKDKTNAFNPQNCNCRLDILENGKVLYSQAVFQDNKDLSQLSAAATYTFPQRDVYQIVVSGNPRSGKSFPPFKLSYELRVDREGSPTDNASTTWLSTHIVPLVVVSVTAVILFSFAIRNILKKKGGGLND